MSEVYRLVKQKVIKTDVPDEFLDQLKQIYISKYEGQGYCFLRSQISEWIGSLEDKDQLPFRWLSLYYIYIGKKRVKDVDYCNKLREGIRGNAVLVKNMTKSGMVRIG